MDSTKLYKLTLIFIFIIIFIQIAGFFNSSQIIEENNEHMNASLLTHQIEDLARLPSDNPQIQYYYKSNRYVQQNSYPQLTDPLARTTGLTCTPQFDWNVNLSPGANNTYGDVLWHQTSPKMILQDNNMSCGKYTKNTTLQNPPMPYISESYDNMQKYDDIVDEQIHYGGMASGLPLIKDNFLDTCNVGKFVDVQGKIQKM